MKEGPTFVCGLGVRYISRLICLSCLSLCFNSDWDVTLSGLSFGTKGQLG